MPAVEGDATHAARYGTVFFGVVPTSSDETEADGRARFDDGFWRWRWQRTINDAEVGRAAHEQKHQCGEKDGQEDEGEPTPRQVVAHGSQSRQRRDAHGGGCVVCGVW